MGLPGLLRWVGNALPSPLVIAGATTSPYLMTQGVHPVPSDATAEPNTVEPSPEADHASEVHTVEHVLITLVDLVQSVRLGDQLVQLELTGLVQGQEVGDVEAWVGRTEDHPFDFLLHHGQVKEVHTGLQLGLRRSEEHTSE